MLHGRNVEMEIIKKKKYITIQLNVTRFFLIAVQFTYMGYIFYLMVKCPEQSVLAQKREDFFFFFYFELHVIYTRNFSLITFAFFPLQSKMRSYEW